MQVKNLDFYYKKKQVFDNLNVNFADDQVNVVIGPNGIGKTTFLEIITRVQPVDNNAELNDFPETKDVMYQFQNMEFFPFLKVGQLLQLFVDMSDKPVEQNAIMAKIYNDILSDLIDTKLGELSGGEFQIVMTYAICSLDKELYIFDEPISGVDSSNANLMMELINSLVVERHKKVIMTLHQLDQLRKCPFNIIFLNKKQCTFSGNVDDLISKTKADNLDDAFNILKSIDSSMDC